VNYRKRGIVRKIWCFDFCDVKSHYDVADGFFGGYGAAGLVGGGVVGLFGAEVELEEVVIIYSFVSERTE